MSPIWKKSAKSILVFLFCAAFTQAASTDWKINKHGQVRLLSEYSVAPASGTIWFGLEHRTVPGWHVYWKNSGDAGYSPRLKWTGSQGFEALPLSWPAPTKFILPGDLVAYGYEGQVVYPIEVHVRPGAKSLHVVLDLDYLTCSEPCVPYRYTFNLDLPIGAAAKRDSEAQALIQRFRRQIPAASVSDEQIQNYAPVERIGVRANDRPPAGFWFMLCLAFLGGLILNAMPCVLPVLSIKLLGLLKHSGQHRSTITRHALASAAGIVSSFLGLGLLAVILKSAGHGVGWGTQFQNPFFVGFLFIVVFLFALNLWGLFEIPMPRFIGSAATAYASEETLTSHFFSGLFATLLATPCSAPFLGTAMGFALAQSAGTIVAIFVMAGLGMSVPYLSLAVFPGTLHWLPRPGAWMGRLKIILGGLLMATAIWLGWVFFHQLHPQAAQPSVSSTNSRLPWIPLDESELARDLSAGQSVFVDITADWCFTCKYNEKFVLGSTRVAHAFRAQHIVLMQGDWTNRNAGIGRFLNRYGRAGIPFAALFRPGQEPILLPEFLTENIVLEALNKKS